MSITDNFVRSYVAGGDLRAKQFYLVSLQTDEDSTVELTGDGARADGVVQNKPNTGQAATVVTQGVTRAVAGGAFTAGTILGSDSSGRVVDAATGDYVVGVAEEAATQAGDIVKINFYRGGTAAA